LPLDLYPDLFTNPSVADPGCFKFFIPDPDPGASDPGSYCSSKEGLKIKPTFFLLLMVSVTSFIGKK
jgi:hypothetical protein